MNAGDVVRHDKRGIGVLLTGPLGTDKVRVRFLGSTARVLPKRLEAFATRAEVLAALLADRDLSFEQETAALIYLHDGAEAVYMPAAAYFARRPTSPNLVAYLARLGDLRSEPFRGRLVAATQNWPLIPRILRGAARLRARRFQHASIASTCS